jgi:hypothetical protein
VQRQSLTDAAHQFGTPIFGLEAPRPVRRQGTVGHSVSGDERHSHFELYFVVSEAKEWVRVDSRLVEQRTDLLVANLVSNAALGGAIRFPLNLSVERVRIRLPVDGEAVDFDAYLCRRLAVAAAEIEGRWVYVHASKTILRKLALRRETAGQLRRFLGRLDKSYAERWATVEAVGGQRTGAADSIT